MLRKLTTMVAVMGLLTLLATPLVLAQQGPGLADLPSTTPTILPNCVSAPPPAPPGSAHPNYIACSPDPGYTGGSSGQGDTGFQQYAPNDYCLRTVDLCVIRHMLGQ